MKDQKIKIAILGASRVGANLAEELLSNRMAAYIPQCFIDNDLEKVGKRFAEFRFLQKIRLFLINYEITRFRKLFLQFRFWT